MNVSRAIRTRRSIRAFLPKAVPQALVEEILSEARYAPSGSNFQPWQVHAVAGKKRDQIVADALAAFAAGESQSEWAYYPENIPEPYLSRRRATGWGLYSLLGIEKGNRAASAEQQARNYSFFDAPVGLFFFIDGELELGSWLDYGMFLQNIMLLAREYGLHSCAQASWPELHHVVRQHLPLSDTQQLVCGLSLGYADPNAKVNTYQPLREPVSAFAQFHAFETDR